VSECVYRVVGEVELKEGRHLDVIRPLMCNSVVIVICDVPDAQI
jgi:hypothetical protein